MTDFRERIERVRADHHRLVDSFLDRHGGDIDRLARVCVESLRSGGKLLFFGNGGSASDAQHLAAEFVNRYDRDRPALAALALGTDGSVLTSISNDSDFREIFARQIEALGRPGDVAVGITTSGNSPNVVAGLRAARRLGLRTAAFLGRDGGEAVAFAEIALLARGQETARIQEIHILAGHLVCERVEDLVAEAASPSASGAP